MSPPSRVSGDAGVTLIEILMTVVLLGLAGVALLSGMATVSLGSDIHRKQTDAEVVLASAVERLKDPDVQHIPCADRAVPAKIDGYLAAARSASVPTGWDPATTIDITSPVRYWNGADFGPTCYDTDALGHLLTLQELTVEVRSPDGRAVESVTVVRGPAKAGTP
jgi:Tfp pilus assembly protein PilV